MSKKINVTDTILRDAHQSLLATRMRTEDMLPICPKLDQVGYWSLEVWGGATFDACVRFLKEDPWERLRQLRAALPNTRLQMLLRGQNLLGTTATMWSGPSSPRRPPVVSMSSAFSMP
jgi:pyruvate carboxylase subunit B